MSSGKGASRAARADAEASAEEARRLRSEIDLKEKAERDKVQRKLIRGVKGRFNPFEILPDVNTLGGEKADG